MGKQLLGKARAVQVRTCVLILNAHVKAGTGVSLDNSSTAVVRGREMRLESAGQLAEPTQ